MVQNRQTSSWFKPVVLNECILERALKQAQVLKKDAHTEKILNGKPMVMDCSQYPAPRKFVQGGLVSSLCLPFCQYADLASVFEACNTEHPAELKHTVDTMGIHDVVLKALKSLESVDKFVLQEMMKYFEWCTNPSEDRPSLNFPECCFHPPCWGSKMLGPYFASIDESNPQAYLYALYESDSYQQFRVCLLPGCVTPGEKQVGRFVFYIWEDEAYTGTWQIDSSEDGQPMISWEGKVRGAMSGTFQLDWNVEKQAFDLKHGSEILHRRTECLVDVSVDLPQEQWSRAARRIASTAPKLTQRPGCRVYLDQVERRLKYKVLQKKPCMASKPSYATPALVTPRVQSRPSSQSSQFWSHNPLTNAIQQQKDFRAQKVARDKSKRTSFGRQAKRPNKHSKKKHASSRVKCQRKRRTRSQRNFVLCY